MHMKPLVSVVIPTHRRPTLVLRAVESVLKQSLSQIEVIVVINGTDEAETQRSLATISDPRLKVIDLPYNCGSPSVPRNTGVEAAQADWIAHLDDDDEWLPHKLERQYDRALRSPHALPIISCYLIARGSESEAIAPRRLPDPQEPISDYLFVRRSYFQGEGLVQCSTIFTPKALMQQVPFDHARSKHEDWDWLIRACRQPGVGVEFVPEPLSIWHLDDQRVSMSRTHDWGQSLAWIRAERDFVTRRAYSSFVMAEVAAHAAHDRDWRAFVPLLLEALRHGQPRLADYSLFLGMWLLPPHARSWLRALLSQDWLKKRLSTLKAVIGAVPS
jgi:glycosyltransferase involved in cell wall biosynthesis